MAGGEARSRRLRVLGAIAIVTTIAGAVFDWRENREMLALLTTGSGDPRPPSLIKWLLLSVAIASSTPVFLLGPVHLFQRAIGYAGIVSALWGRRRQVASRRMPAAIR